MPYLPKKASDSKGEFFTYAPKHNKIKKIHKNGFDLILSDMAPNTIGHSKTDHLRIIQMAEDIYQFSIDFLKKGSSLVIKILQGSNEKEIILLLKKKFRLFASAFEIATSQSIFIFSSLILFMLNQFTLLIFSSFGQ